MLGVKSFVTSVVLMTVVMCIGILILNIAELLNNGISQGVMSGLAITGIGLAFAVAALVLIVREW